MKLPRSRKPPDPKAAARKKALRALRRARLTAAKSGVELSDWEGGFLDDVESRVTTYGRAFADPEKGAPGTALSLRQALKLKEIVGKASGAEKPPMRRRGFGGRARSKPDKVED